MRTRIFVATILTLASPEVVFSQTTKADSQEKAAAPAQQNFDPPKAKKPDEAGLKEIAAKTQELREAIAVLKQRKIPDKVLIEVEIYFKAAENIVRFEEWYAPASGKWAITTLDQGLVRAKQAQNGKAVWSDATGQWVIRAYRSSVDGSIQPYAVLLPHDYLSKKDWRLDVVLHGRDSSLTEAKFIATHQANAPKELGYVQLEVYGRGNNAYRWVGESDVFEAIHAFRFGAPGSAPVAAAPINPNRIVLRGFSMGGAGTWHLGLHHPARFCLLGPGAGFTTTRGYVGNLPKQLPDYIEKCLHIYDAVDYAENVFNVPVVAYSGEKDPQKKAATNIEAALAGFSPPHVLTHLIAPGLEHQMPKEWQEKAEAEYRKYADGGRTTPDRIRFITYTPKFGKCDWIEIDALRTTYERAMIDGVRKGNDFNITTKNARRIGLSLVDQTSPLRVTIDGQEIDTKTLNPSRVATAQFEFAEGTWAAINDPVQLSERLKSHPEKRAGLQGPVDDAFSSKFVVIGPAEKGFYAGIDQHLSARLSGFAKVWDKYFRADLPMKTGTESAVEGHRLENVVLFGDPRSNPRIAEVLPHLPITWTAEKLVVNGVEYDAATHLPVLIYPDPLNPSRYLVLNSGHTFQESDLQGTNALLYPRLGDWGVIKPAPTEKNPDAYEVIAAGLFDENWKFKASEK